MCTVPFDLGIATMFAHHGLGLSTLLAVSRFALVHVLLLVGIRTCDFGFSKVRSRSIWKFSDRARSQILAISPLTPCRII